MTTKLLIGPLFNPQFLGNYHQDTNIKLFMPESAYTQRYPYDLVYPWENLQDFSQILELLPSNWQPDLLIWWDVLYQGIPPGIERCPYPIALIPGDWNLGYLTTRHFAEIFDLVLADIHLKQRLEAEDLKHIVHWPGFSYNPKELYLLPEQERIYDVCFIGNLNETIHPRRSQIIDRALSLSGRYQIFVKQGVWGSEYLQILNKSKIVLNYTIAQVMNMRGYEAPACGALLFIEEENLEIPYFLKDREECVYYRADNLVELLIYYLENEEERQRIAKNGHQKIQSFSYEKQFEQLLKQLPEWLPIAQAQKTKRLAHPTQTAQYTLKSLSQFFCSQPEARPSSLQLITQALNHIQTTPDIPDLLWQLNALACLLFPLEDTTTTTEDSTLQLVKRCFEQGLNLAPNHPVFHYHLALCLEKTQEIYLAMQHYSRSVELLAGKEGKELREYREFILPFFRSRGREVLAIEWERASFEEQQNQGQLQSRYIRLFMCQIWQRLGHLLEKTGSLEKSIIAYQNALCNFSDAKIYVKLARLNQLSNQEERAWDYFSSGLKEQPFLISQVEMLFSPSLFLKHRNEIHAKVLRYSHVFGELAPTLALCECLNRLEDPQSTFTKVKAHLKYMAQQTPGALEKLKQLLEYGYLPPHPILTSLRRHNSIYWENVYEPPPTFKHSTTFSWTPVAEQAMIQIKSESRAENDYIRQWIRLTALPQREIGPEQWPLHFPAEHSSRPLPLDLENWLNDCEYVFLALVETLSDSQIQPLLMAFEKEFKDSPNTGLLLYSPQSSGTLYLHCENFINQSNVTLIDEKLHPEEWESLLNQTDCILVSPQEAEGFYISAWALWKGIPLCLYSLPILSPWPGPELWRWEEWQPKSPPHEILTAQKQNQAAARMRAQTCSQRLKKSYQTESETAVLSVLWQIRLQELELWD